MSYHNRRTIVKAKQQPENSVSVADDKPENKPKRPKRKHNKKKRGY